MNKEQTDRYQEFIRGRRISILRTIMSTQAGRLFIGTLVEETAPLTEAYKGNADTYYFLGKQSIGRHILSNLIFSTPDLLDLFKIMMEETKKLREEAMSYAGIKPNSPSE